MNNRTLEKLNAVLIIATCIAGLLFSFGFPDTLHGEGLKMYSVLLAVLVLIYYIAQLRRMRSGRKGFVFSDVRCWLMMAEWNFAIVSWIFLGPMHASLGKHMQAGAFVLTVIIPAELALDWLIGAKGTFRADYVPKSYLLFVPYTAVALLMGNSGHGFGFGSAKYPYPFLNADQLGWQVVALNLVLIAAITLAAGYLYVLLDYVLGRQK